MEQPSQRHEAILEPGNWEATKYLLYWIMFVTV